MSNKFTALLILVLASGYTLAQPVTIKKQNEKVKGESTEGFAVALDGKRDDVNAQWSKFLKEIGRVKLFSSENFLSFLKVRWNLAFSFLSLFNI